MASGAVGAAWLFQEGIFRKPTKKVAHGLQHHMPSRSGPDDRTQISGFTRIGSSVWGPGSDMALSALKGLALNTNQGAGSIGPVAEAFGLKLEIDRY